MIDVSAGFVPLVIAAQRLKLTYHQAHALVLRGVLQGEKRGSRWMVTVQSLEALTQARLLGPPVPAS